MEEKELRTALTHWLICKKDFLVFKKEERYWLELLSNGYLCGRSDNIKGVVINDFPYDQFYDMMCIYFLIVEREIERKGWFDAWGDLFMSLITKGGYKGQFFTPSNICNMMSEVTFHEEPEAKQMTTFGNRIIINDCACGSSRNLLAANAIFQRNEWRKPYLVAEDIDTLCCKMSAVNLMVHGCFGEVICHDTLCEPDKVRSGYIINETMYPFPTNMPSIRPCNDANRFFGIDIWKKREMPTEGLKTASTAKQTRQLELF